MSELGAFHSSCYLCGRDLEEISRDRQFLYFINKSVHRLCYANHLKILDHQQFSRMFENLGVFTMKEIPNKDVSNVYARVWFEITSDDFPCLFTIGWKRGSILTEIESLTGNLPHQLLLSFCRNTRVEINPTKICVFSTNNVDASHTIRRMIKHLKVAK